MVSPCCSPPLPVSNDWSLNSKVHVWKNLLVWKFLYHYFIEKQPGELNIGSHEIHSGLRGDVKTQVVAISTIRDHFQV